MALLRCGGGVVAAGGRLLLFLVVDLQRHPSITPPFDHIRRYHDIDSVIQPPPDVLDVLGRVFLPISILMRLPLNLLKLRHDLLGPRIKRILLDLRHMLDPREGLVPDHVRDQLALFAALALA